MTNGLTDGLVTFIVYVVAIATLLRAFPQWGPSTVVVGLAVFLTFTAPVILFVLGRPVNIWAFLCSYFFFTLCFLMAFGALFKSVSLRMLSDLANKPGRSESYDRLFGDYVTGDSFADRLAIAQNKQFALKEGSRYRLTERGRVLATNVRNVQRLFGITRSG